MPTMTKNQLEHRQEQGEAARREFRVCWYEIVVPVLVEFNVPHRMWWAVEHACWNLFKQTKGNQK